FQGRAASSSDPMGAGGGRPRESQAHGVLVPCGARSPRRQDSRSRSVERRPHGPVAGRLAATVVGSRTARRTALDANPLYIGDMRVGAALAIATLLTVTGCKLNTDYFSDYRGKNLLSSYDF